MNQREPGLGDWQSSCSRPVWGDPYDTSHLDRPAPAEAEGLIDKGLEALRHVSDLSQDARVLKSAAADAIEEGVHAVKRTAKTMRRDALDLRDEVTYRVKREPLRSLAFAFAAGTLAGLLLAVFRPKRTDGHGGRDTGC